MLRFISNEDLQHDKINSNSCRFMMLEYLFRKIFQKTRIKVGRSSSQNNRNIGTSIFVPILNFFLTIKPKFDTYE